MKLSKKWQIVALSFALIFVMTGGVLFLGSLAGWFDNQKVTLSADYYNNPAETTIDQFTLESMLSSKQSFILISYLPTCTNDIIKFLKDYSESYKISYFYINWSSLRETTLKDAVKFSPSVVIIKDGKPIDFLKADSNDYISQYSSYTDFEKWLNRYIIY